MPQMLLVKLLLVLAIQVSHAGGRRERSGHGGGGVCVLFLLLLFWSKRRLEALLSMSLERQMEED